MLMEMGNKLRTLWLGLLLTSWPLVVSAVETTVNVKLEDESVTVGVTTVLQIDVVNGDPIFPENLSTDALEIVNSGSNFKNIEVGGEAALLTQAFYIVEGKEPGTHTIPSITLMVNGKEFTTEALTLEVIKMSSGDVVLDPTRRQFLNFHASKQEAYVYEMIPVECILYVRGSSEIKTGYPKFENSDKFVIQPFPSSYNKQRELIEGTPFLSVTYPSSISALSPGEHELGPALLTARLSNPTNSGVVPVIPYSQARTLTSNPLSFTIKPLPLEGRPEEFSGAVGRFTVKTQASPLELKVGDPLSVDIQVMGTGNFDSVNAPGVPSGMGWKVYPPNRLEESGLKEAEQMVRFSQVVIPTEEMTELPALKFAFFDPNQEEYVTVSSAPIPLTITPDPLALNKIGAAALESVGFRGEELNDILFINTGPARWMPLHGNILDRPAFWIMNFLPAIGLLAILLMGYRQWSKEAARRHAARKYLTPGELRQRLGHERVNRGTFYTALLECFERMRGEHSDLMNRLTQDARTAWERLHKQGNLILYSGAQAGNEAVTREEKRDALLTLQELDAIHESA